MPGRRNALARVAQNKTEKSDVHDLVGGRPPMALNLRRPKLAQWNNLNSHLASDYGNRLQYNGLPIARLRDENSVSLPVHDALDSIELPVSRRASSHPVAVSRVQDQRDHCPNELPLERHVRRSPGLV